MMSVMFPGLTRWPYHRGGLTLARYKLARVCLDIRIRRATEQYPAQELPEISLNRPALTYPRVAAFLHPVTPVGSNPLPPPLRGLPVSRYRLIGFPLFDFHVLAVVLGCQLGLAQRGVDLSQGLMGVPSLELR